MSTDITHFSDVATFTIPALRGHGVIFPLAPVMKINWARSETAAYTK